jgi:hypothetical protein
MKRLFLSLAPLVLLPALAMPAQAAHKSGKAPAAKPAAAKSSGNKASSGKTKTRSGKGRGAPAQAVAGTENTNPPSPAELKAADFSGTYACTGQDAQEGPYTGTVKLTRVEAHSTGNQGSYQFTLEVPGYGLYSGEAVSDGTMMAMHFALPDQTNRDYGTGIARFIRTKQGKWMFNKFYYEPEFKGGNHGSELCVQQ